MKLYTTAQSRGFRVSWATQEMGLDLDYEMMAFPPRRTTPEYLDLNPLGTVPLLVDGDVHMTESCAIVHYLAARYGQDLLLPTDHPEYGNLLDWSYHADATLTFPQTVFMRYGLFEKKRGFEEAGELYFKWYLARLIKIENRLDQREFLCGEKFTIADVNVGYALFLSKAIGRDGELPPRTRNYLEQMCNRDGFKAALAKEDEVAGQSSTT